MGYRIFLVLLLLGNRPAACQQPACWVIDSIQIAAVGEHNNTFSARVANRCAKPDTLQLDLRAISGQWVIRAWQNQFTFGLAPGERRVVHAHFDVMRLTPEATLRVTFGPLDHYFLRHIYDIGRDNPHARDLTHGMLARHTSHLDIYARPGSLAGQRLSQIGAEREHAINEIAALLGVSFHDRITLVFYPDSATKVNETGHIGAGLAFSNNIVEIYNTQLQLDPYHEIAHVVARRLGEPPAAFNEGFAVYVSERLGGDALGALGYPGQRIDAVARALRATKQLLHVDSLLHFNEIGSAESQPMVAYPEAASFVKYLVEKRGLPRFRQAYHQLMATDDSVQWRVNARELERIYGVTLRELEADWLAALAHNAGSSRSRARRQQHGRERVRWPRS
jgi:hypothetical protein